MDHEFAYQTFIPFIPDGWAASAGGFPAMTERGAFLMKDLVLFAASFYLLKQDALRVPHTANYSDLVKKAQKAA